MHLPPARAAHEGPLPPGLLFWGCCEVRNGSQEGREEIRGGMEERKARETKIRQERWEREKRGWGQGDCAFHLVTKNK